MAYYGRQGYPARSPNVISNPYGNRPNIRPAYVNRGFSQSPYYPRGYGQPPRRQPTIAPRPQPRAQPQPRNTRMQILCVIISVVAVLVILGIIGAVIGVVLWLPTTRSTTLPPTTPPDLATATLSVALNMDYSPALADPTSNAYQELAMQFETEMAGALKAEFGDRLLGVKVTSFRPGSVVVTFTVQSTGQSDESIKMAVQRTVSDGMLDSLSVDPNSVQGGTTNPQPTQGPMATQAPQPQPTQAPQPQPTQAPQPQPTQAPQPQPTQAPQPQPTQAPQPQPTQAPQPQPTQAPQPQPTQAPQPQPTQAPQPPPTQAPQPQPTQAPQPQPTAAPPPIEGDIFGTRICGTQPALANRIIGGTNAQLGEWPWIGALEENGEPGCGATLLNERWAITATHCFVFSMEQIADGAKPPDTIVLGITNTRTPESGSQTRGFTAFNHPSYDIDDPETKFDITLLRLSETVSFTDNINPICLATLVEETTMYTNCKAAGWGNTIITGDPAITDDPVYPDELKEVNLPLISSATCDISSNIICAGASEGGIDTCQGDSGGPLICKNRVDNSWHLVGVVSSGPGCGLPNTPASYTRVTQFKDWIQTTINQNT